MDLLNSYLDNLERGGKSEATLRVYRKDLGKFFAYFNISDISDFEKLTVDDYDGFYKAQNISDVSLNGLIRSLSSFFVYMRETKRISRNAPNAFFDVRFGKSRFLKETKKKRVVLNREEEKLVIDAGSNKQEKLMVAMLFKTALRRDEIAGIKLSDISGCQILITGKGGDEAYTYLNENLCAMLNDYLATERNTDSEYLFYGVRGIDSKDGRITGTSVNNRMIACAKRAGINKKITAHTARRTKITRTAIEKGKFAAQMLARHVSDKTTDRYIFAGDQMVQDILMEND